MKIEKLSEEKLNELESKLINTYTMDMVLFNIIDTIKSTPPTRLDNDHLRDLNLLKNSNHLSIREKEIRLKYINLLIKRNMNNGD